MSVCWEDKNDAEFNHLPERVTWFVREGLVSLRSYHSEPDRLPATKSPATYAPITSNYGSFGEMGTTKSIVSGWKTVKLQRTYKNLVVVGSFTDNGRRGHDPSSQLDLKSFEFTVWETPECSMAVCTP